MAIKEDIIKFITEDGDEFTKSNGQSYYKYSLNILGHLCESAIEKYAEIYLGMKDEGEIEEVSIHEFDTNELIDELEDRGFMVQNINKDILTLDNIDLGLLEKIIDIFKYSDVETREKIYGSVKKFTK